MRLIIKRKSESDVYKRELSPGNAPNSFFFMLTAAVTCQQRAAAERVSERGEKKTRSRNISKHFYLLINNEVLQDE